ncbi:calmodulin-dependent protein kinase [Gigaspora margarita]|uniref:Calmodulin-dependent protein kinase n=1 Tax=Gigaspora margarita TaxID=4874 RepID=A0A8H4B1Y5_GIGMA|nr:calmodulin-dependent protein kinase [Gigaspora margarita]
MEEQIEDEISKKICRYEYDEFYDFREIGKSRFGMTVYKSKWKKRNFAVTHKNVTIDTIQNDSAKIDTIQDDKTKITIQNNKTFQEFTTEIRQLQKVGFHENIIDFYGITKRMFFFFFNFSESEWCYNIVQLFASDGNLREYLNEKFLRLRWIDKSRIANEISNGLKFLHQNNIVHQDINSKNILVHEGKIKIAGFGLSKMTEATSLIDERFFDLDSIAYTEPQCLKIKYENNLTQEPDVYNLTQKSDIYSLGVVLWEISSGKPPFKSFSPRESLANHILKGNREEPMEKDTPQQYIDLYKKCWDNEPAKRPEMNEILEILTNIYYQTIEKIELKYEKWGINKELTF